MTSARDVLKIAEKYLGTCEKPPNSNHTAFGRWYPVDGEPWCAKFVSYVLDEAGIARYRHKYTPSGADLFKADGRWHSDGTTGDVAFFDFPGDGLFRISHVGFVESRQGDNYHTIEGNTSPPGGGSDRDGGGVYRRVRHRSLIVGFGRPDYGDKPSGPTILREGSTGRRVLEWQRDLNLATSAGLEDDGEFGPATRRATVSWQRSVGLEADGEVGPKSLRKMAAVLGEKEPQQTLKRARVLKLGSEGGAVRRLQRRLRRRGHELQSDGVFGPKTLAAVKDFQRQAGLAPDGEVGPLTWRALGL